MAYFDSIGCHSVYPCCSECFVPKSTGEKRNKLKSLFRILFVDGPSEIIMEAKISSKSNPEKVP